jgi:hypothetical protein
MPSDMLSGAPLKEYLKPEVRVMIIGYSELSNIPVSQRKETLVNLRKKYGDFELKKKWGASKFYYQLKVTGLRTKNQKQQQKPVEQPIVETEVVREVEKYQPIRESLSILNVILVGEVGSKIHDRLLRLADFVKGNEEYDVEIHIRERIKPVE